MSCRAWELAARVLFFVAYAAFAGIAVTALFIQWRNR